MKRALLKVEEDSILDSLLDDHVHTGVETPLRKDAFELSDREKITEIAHHVHAIMHTLGLEMSDESLRDTPMRVAKMYVTEVFKGLNPANKPSISLFTNNYKYSQILLERNIKLYSYCEHHLVPIIGKVHIAYIPDKYVIGLSKLNRIAQYYAKRPQVQERLTEQIADELKKALQTEHVAVIIEADHLCVASRGVEDTHSDTVTAHYSGKFNNEQTRNELMTLLHK